MSTLLVLLLCIILAANIYMFYRAKERTAHLKMVLYTKLGWGILGTLVLLWLILSGRLRL